MKRYRNNSRLIMYYAAYSLIRLKLSHHDRNKSE